MLSSTLKVYFFALYLKKVAWSKKHRTEELCHIHTSRLNFRWPPTLVDAGNSAAKLHGPSEGWGPGDKRGFHFQFLKFSSFLRISTQIPSGWRRWAGSTKPRRFTGCAVECANTSKQEGHFGAVPSILMALSISPFNNMNIV